MDTRIKIDPQALSLLDPGNISICCYFKSIEIYWVVRDYEVLIIILDNEGYYLYSSLEECEDEKI